MSQDAHSMGTGPELFLVCSPFGNPTIRGSLATDPLQIRCIPTTRGADTTMLNRFAMLASVCVAIPVGGRAPRAGRSASAPGSRGACERDQSAAAGGCRSVGASRGPRHPGRLASRSGRRQRDPAAGGPVDHRDLVARVPGRGHLHRQDHRRRQDQADRRIDGGRRADRLRHHLRRDRDQPGRQLHPGHCHSVHRAALDASVSACRARCT